MSKKVLLLTASYGTGHGTASKFVQKSLNELFKDEIETKIVDFLKVNSKEGRIHIFEKIYNWTMEKPHVWDFIFDISNGQLAHFYFTNIFPKFFKNMFDIFDAEKPDLCVTSHPYWNFIIDLYNKTRKNSKEKALRYICIVTDSTEIHRTWVSENTMNYMVCDSESKELMINKYKVPAEKIRITGFPVNPDLGKPLDRDAFLRSLELNPKMLTLLFVVGLGDVKKFIRIIEYLAGSKSKNFQVIIITGKYKVIYDELAKKTFEHPTKVIGWTDKMPDFIRSCDLVISKCGGAIVMETLACGKPIFIPVFTPGQERGNAMLLKKHGFGFVEEKYEKIAGLLDNIISNPKTVYDMQSKIQQYSKPFASQDIARFIKTII
ncbi:MAG: glycosyltransferase [Elusimicrobiota bacterium]